LFNYEFQELYCLCDSLQAKACTCERQAGDAAPCWACRLLANPERFELVVLAGDQSACAMVDVCQRSEAVPLDLVQPFWMGEQGTGTAERHGLELRKGQLQLYKPSRWALGVLPNLSVPLIFE
jgi:hypothetical protein